MRVARRQWLVAVLTLAFSIVAACDDTTAPPAPGGIRVVIDASGEDVSTQGLRVSIANGPVRQLDSGSMEVVILGLPPGTHMVRLEGMSANCQVGGANPKPVEIRSQESTTVRFDLVCAARTGSIRVETTTIGSDLDPDGYVASVVGGPSASIAANGIAVIPGLREGYQTVTLGGVAPNCSVANGNAISVHVNFGGTSGAGFLITCVRSGTLEVTVSTSGAGIDPNGYTVSVQSLSAAFGEARAVAANGSVTFSRLRPAADYRVALQGIAPNCAVTGANSYTVAITEGATTSASFAVSCEPSRPLAFESGNDIYVMNSNGSGATRLTTDPAADGEPAWSVNGRIAFMTNRHAGDGELYVMNEDGTNPVRITTSAGLDDSPSWSPDGQRIVFRSGRDVNSEIYVVNADGTGLTRLTTHAAADFQPAWSSTGKIAFVSDRDHPAGEIYVMNEDGSNLVRLTQNTWAESSPAWSPDGSQLAFARVTDCYYYYGCTQDIIVMSGDGSNERRLPTESAVGLSHGDPSWAPNGRTIAFTRQYCPYYCDPIAVWIINLDGSHLATLAENATNPAWKP